MDPKAIAPLVRRSAHGGGLALLLGAWRHSSGPTSSPPPPSVAAADAASAAAIRARLNVFLRRLEIAGVDADAPQREALERAVRDALGALSGT